MYECDLEESVPIPSGVGKSYPSVRERAQAALKAASLLMVEGYNGPQDPSEDLQGATKTTLEGLSKESTVEVRQAAASVTRTPAGALYLNSILTQYDMQIVEDSSRLRNYVTNKLLVEAENPDARIRIKALELLGKISDVGLFTERSEVTINNRSTVELEDTLRDKIRKLMGADDAEDAIFVGGPVQISGEIDVDEALQGLGE